MKRRNIQLKVMLTSVAVAMLFCLPSCPYIDDYGYDYDPVYMTRAELEASVKFAPAKELTEAGKIYVYDDKLFICEPYKGVHVINNSDPRNPYRTDFIEVPGCVDIAVQNNILYADNAVDLVAIDLAEQKEVAREQNAFKSIAPPSGWWVVSEENEGKIIVGFTKRTAAEVIKY